MKNLRNVVSIDQQIVSWQHNAAAISIQSWSVPTPVLRIPMTVALHLP